MAIESGSLDREHLESPLPETEYLPMHITQTREENGLGIRLDIAVGRGLWMFAMKSVLTNSVRVVLQHRWTILKSPPHLPFFTSDDPSICLNFYENGRYDFKGGWGYPKAEMILPLGPYHLLYAQVGNSRPPRRGTVIDTGLAVQLRQVIAEHAHRMIFASRPDDDVAAFRPRIVDQAAYGREQEAWEKWHLEQLSIEQQMKSPK